MVAELQTRIESSLLGGTLSNEIVKLVERVGPSIVQVNRQGRGGGAGVIWRTDGSIITNHHVVGGRGGAITVLLPDGRELPAEVVNQNPALDLALLKVDAHDLTAALVDDSSRLRVGEIVFAVGHPWGQRNVVTAGIVSGVGDVPIPGSGRSAQYVRSDVRVAPGNSGGAMLNARGAVVGITAMIFGGDMAVGIPSHVAEAWVAGLPSRRVYLGVGVEPVETPLAPTPDGRSRRAAGLLLVSVDPAGPAGRSGLLVGDVLLAAAGRPVIDGDTLQEALGDRASGGTLPLHVLRGGAVRQLDVDLGGTEQSA